MIERINTLKRIGRFTELRCERGGDAGFVRFNVVFAQNASGKSTLCDVFRSLNTLEPAYLLGRKRIGANGDPEIVVALAGAAQPRIVRFQNGSWHDAAAAPKIHVYDERFVADNVFVGHHINVGQRRNLYGLVIGAQGIELKQAVDAAEQELSVATIEFNGANGNLLAMLPEGHSLESFRVLPEIPNVDNQITTASEALASATQTKLKADAIRQRGHLQPIRLPAIPADFERVLVTTLNDVALAAEGKIQEHLQLHTEGLSVDWIGQGHRAQRGTICPHCGQEMTGLELLQAYRSFFSGELQQQERARNETIRAAERAFGERAQSELREGLTAHRTEQEWWNDAGGFQFELPQMRAIADVFSILLGTRRALVDGLARKQANPGAVVALTEAEVEAISAWREVSTELVAYNDALIALNVTLDQKKLEAGTVDLEPLKKAVADLEACKKRHAQNINDAYVAYDLALRRKADAERAKRTANEALRDQSGQILTDYGVRINALLELFAADFRIVSEGVNFRGGPPSGQLAVEILGTRISSSSDDAADPARPSLANTLSGGDRSALALAFFIAVVEQDPELANCIVVFDDPFHSQDRSRQRRTIERIHRISALAKQCFVFSHDLDFARAVESIREVPARTFLLSPLGDHVTLEAKPLPMLPSRAYETKYALLTEFIRQPAEFAGQLNNIAGTLRTILEEYLQFKFPQRWEDGRDWLGTMIGKIREATGDDPLRECRDLIAGLTEVNDYSQRFHHRTTGATADVPDVRELGTYANQALSLIHQ